jgi:hypothetical protein
MKLERPGLAPGLFCSNPQKSGLFTKNRAVFVLVAAQLLNKVPLCRLSRESGFLRKGIVYE